MSQNEWFYHSLCQLSNLIDFFFFLAIVEKLLFLLFCIFFSVFLILFLPFVLLRQRRGVFLNCEPNLYVFLVK
jgi:hypothetical protein